MSAAGSADELRSKYQLYDRHVDIVSAYHFLFCEAEEMSATVRHFERYPKVTDGDGKTVTPDFSVLFHDGRGYIVEIANLPLHPNGVEKLAKQLLAYDTCSELPDGKGGTAQVTSCDIIFITRVGDGSDAVKRLRALFEDEEHWFKPQRMPAVYENAQEPDRYVFMHVNAADNGSLRFSEDGTKPDLAEFGPLKVKPHMFARNKAQHAFMNDPIQPLYLATTLWSKVFPSLYGVDTFEATSAEIAEVLRDQYSVGRKSDVDAAMALLQRAGLATKKRGSNAWLVRRVQMRTRGEDVHEQFLARLEQADKRATAASAKSTARSRKQLPGQGELFQL